MSRQTSPSTDFGWAATPAETDQQYFRTWQRLSVHLQKEIRPWVSERYFRDIARTEDRDSGYPTVLYAACRPCYGRRPADFTYDVADPSTLPAAWRTIGRALRIELARVVQQIDGVAPPPLVRRYAPVWHQDILLAVQKKPRRLISLLACEAALINTLIDWGTIRTAGAEKRFAKTLATAARAFELADPAELRIKVLKETERALLVPAHAPDSPDDVLD
ncbi:MAG: hypothetical protein ABSB35_15405 [Bryobacteraceae bacterium]